MINRKDPNGGNRNAQSSPIHFLVIVVAAIVAVAWIVSILNPPKATIPYSSFLLAAESGEITSVVIRGTVAEARYGEAAVRVVLPPDHGETIRILREAGVGIEVKKESMWGIMLIWWTPMLLLVGVFYFFFIRSMGGAGGGATRVFGMTKTRAKTLKAHIRVTFRDVAGVEEPKEELQEIVGFLKDPMRFRRLGAKIPRGVLMMGPPGCGKTLLARAVAGEADVPFFYVSGSDFVEMFVGVGAGRVRDTFLEAKKNAPSILFIDEIDSIGRQRGAGLGGGHDEREQTLNQLLSEMDGFEGDSNVIVIAATNRPDVLDSALTRPGRFDRRVIVDRPDVRGRVGILQIHTRDIPLAGDVDLTVIAKGTPGFVGADLQNLANEAALSAARFGRDYVTAADFDEARDKVMMGRERRSLLITDEQKQLTAYHEAGHALAAHFLTHADPLHKVTIIPRGQALGVTQQLPDDGRTQTKTQLEDRLCVVLGGRAAEEIIFKDVTTGAESDLQHVTALARKMVAEWGMGEETGLLYWGDTDHVFVGRDLVRSRDRSEATANLIDSEVRKLVDAAYNRVHKILEERLQDLHALAAALLERETLTGEEVTELLRFRTLANV